MKRIKVTILLILFSISLTAQNAIDFSKHAFKVDQLSSEVFENFIKEKIKNSQFILVGEQHGIKEVGYITDAIYKLAMPYGYQTLCIETDAIAASSISQMAKSKNNLALAKEHFKKYPFTIPFYSNEDDLQLFENVIRNDGAIWGIDQTFMVQFRLNLDYLSSKTSNNKFKTKLNALKVQADQAYAEAVEKKDYQAPFIFKYTEETHQSLASLAKSKEEKETLDQLWRTKQIYEYNFSGQYYLNNQTRGQLMKENFMKYYNNSIQQNPKVVFKLGAYHTAKGLTPTNIFDIGNFTSELAQSNQKTSLHIIAMGISGKAAVGNPFATSQSAEFDNSEEFPTEIKEILKDIDQKYYILDLTALRSSGYSKKISKQFKEIIFGYDLIILINDAKPLKMF